MSIVVFHRKLSLELVSCGSVGTVQAFCINTQVSNAQTSTCIGHMHWNCFSSWREREREREGRERGGGREREKVNGKFSVMIKINEI